MSKPRKGKAQRALARQQWDTLRSVRDAVVTDNLKAGPGPKAVKYAVLGDLGRFGARAKVSQLVIRNDSKRLNKRLTDKYRLNDADLYSEKLDVTGGSTEQPMVRVGTTPSRLVVTEKDGERIAFRIPEKGKYRPVGLPDSIPRDGGKGLPPPVKDGGK